MSKGLGNNYMLWVESTTAGTYNLVKGQQGSLTITRSAAEVDLSTKDDGGYGTTARGLKKWTVSGSLLPNLPDASGYTRLETLCQAEPSAPFNIQIRKGGKTGGSGDVVFAGSCYGNLDSTAFEQDGGTPVGISLGGNGAPTTDTLAV